MDIKISDRLSIKLEEIEFSATRSGGNGGQNVNKVSTAIHLRFDILKSSIPMVYKNRLLKLSNKKITKEGVIFLKAQKYRTQEQNKSDSIERLVEIIKKVTVVPKYRISTKPTKNSKKRRVENKKKLSQKKNMRKNNNLYD